MDNLLNEALEYASNGLKVFPLSPMSKIPLKNSKGFLEATNNQEEVFNNFNNERAYNLGVSMVGSDIFVIDVDNHDGTNKGLQSLNKLLNGESLPDDITVVETVNDGYHIYVKAPAGVEIKQQIDFRPSVDIIKNYVVGAGSTTKGKNGSIGTYKLENGSLDDIKEVPPAILKALMDNEKPKQAKGSYKTDYSTKRTGKTFTATFLQEIVTGVSEPGRNVWLTSKIGKLLSLGMDGEEAFQLLHVINENFVTPKLPDKTINIIFDSILNKEKQKEGAK